MHTRFFSSISQRSAGVFDLTYVLALQIIDTVMVKFPDDFWKALKSGDTSDWLFWVDIAIIVGALFVLLCFVRCCMWCFNSKKDDEKYDPNVQDAKVPPAWLHHEHPSQPAGIPPHVRFQPRIPLFHSLRSLCSHLLCLFTSTWCV